METRSIVTLHPARCAEGISKTGAGFRVVRSATGREIGIVARVGDGWCLVCPECPGLNDDQFHHASAESAAIMLNAHAIGHGLDRLLADIDEGRIVVPVRAVR